MKKYLLSMACLLMGVAVPVVSSAAPVVFEGSDTTNFARSASATFDVVGANLIITLTNNSTLDATDQKQILTALF